MRRFTFFLKSIFMMCALAGFTRVHAQTELKILTNMGSRFNDVNDSGQGITQGAYYDFSTETLTPMEDDATTLNAINDNGDVAGAIFLDQQASTIQPGYRIDGTWEGTGWLDGADPGSDDFTTYDISSNGPSVVGQMSEGLDFGAFLINTETQEMTGIFDPDGGATAGYTVNNNGIVGGWVDKPDSGGTLRVPAYFTADGEIVTIPEDELPSSQINEVGD